MSSKLAMRLAKPGLPLVPEPAFGLQTIGSVPQAHSPRPHSVVGTKHGVCALNQGYLSAAFENSIGTARHWDAPKLKVRFDPCE